MDKASLLILTLIAASLTACSGAGSNSAQIPAGGAANSSRQPFTSSIPEATMTPSPIPSNAPNTVWVAPIGGSACTGSGTYGAPYNTVQCAIDAVTSGGYTIALKDGTYTTSNSYLAELTHSGTSDSSPIKVQAQHNLGAVLDGNGSTWAAFGFDNSVSYVTIQGFVIQHFKNAGISANGGSSGATYANNGVAILWNHITTNPGNGVLIGDASHDITIEYNEVDHSGTGSSSCPTPGSTNQIHGLYLEANGAQVSSNVFHDNGCGYDIQYAGEKYDTNPSYGEYNNTFGVHTNNSSTSPGNVVLYAATSGVTPSLVSENNIYLQNSTGTKPIACYPLTPVGSPKITINYDLWTNASGTSMTSCAADVTQGPNDKFVSSADFVGGNPPAAGTGASGYQLLSASPAFGSGKDLSGIVLKDFYGDAPTSPWTIGAFQNFTP